MKSFKTLALGAVVGLSLVGVSSASAANWDPQNTNVTATQEGSGVLTGSAGATVTCSNGSTTLRAVGAVATTTTTTNPVAFTNCVASIGGAATVTTFGDWAFTATSTTNVNVTASSGTGVVATIHIPGLGCDVTVTSPTTINSNTWNNANHTLSTNSTASFPVESTGLCALGVGTSARLNAHFVAAAASIT
jgi:hypothetical protein